MSDSTKASTSDESKIAEEDNIPFLKKTKIITKEQVDNKSLIRLG